MTIAIIGAGAAGMMAAAAIHETNPHARVILIERNNGLGKKVIISGGGRCNVTTGIQDVRTVLTKYPRGGKFLTSAMHRFPPADVYAWFEAHGVPLKTQDDNRVFPQSDNGHDIVGVFESLFAESSTEILLRTHVDRIEKTADGFRVHIRQADPIDVDRVILTTGGQAYRHTGSTGDGYAFAQSLGHTITSLAPSLNSFTAKETWPAQISGLSFPSATIAAPAHKQTFTGPFLFTHKGISGPAVFALSGLIAFETYDPTHPLLVTINLFPDLSHTDMLQEVEQRCEQQSKKALSNIWSGCIPHSLAEHLIRELGFTPSTRPCDIGKKDKLRIAQWLQAIPLHIIARGAGDEFVTAGGVETQEVDPKTMESLRCPGLFFAGEVLNVDGFTGGFNLQASWATGRAAGTAAAQP